MNKTRRTMKPSTPSTLRAVGYVRVSTQEQARSGLGIDSQVERVRAYCAFRGLELVEVIVDAGVSGSIRLSDRAGGRAVCDLVEAGRVDAVVSMKLDRLFRDAADCLDMTRTWDDAGIGLHLLDLGIDTTSAVGRAFLTVAAGFAELEKNLIGERTAAALGQLKAQGVRLGGEAFGVRRTADVDAAGRRTWEAAQDEADVVALMVELRAQGMTLRAIVAELNARGVPTKRGGAWQACTVGKILARVSA
jgi:site-specific DNA recombinase